MRSVMVVAVVGICARRRAALVVGQMIFLDGRGGEEGREERGADAAASGGDEDVGHVFLDFFFFG